MLPAAKKIFPLDSPEKKEQYVWELRLNHKKLYQAAVGLVSTRSARAENRLEDSFEHAHTRLVRRRYFGYDICWLEQAQGWCDAKSLIAVETISFRNNDPEHEVMSQWRYYISSHKATNAKMPQYVRNHWGLENTLLWILDVQMHERRSVRSFAMALLTKYFKHFEASESEKKRKRFHPAYRSVQ